MKKRFWFVAAAVFFVLTAANFSFGADYPTKPIALINPMPPGGSLDIQARAFASFAGDEVYFLSGDELTKYMDVESAKIAKLYAEMVREVPK